MKNQNKPWLDEGGKLLSTEAIKEVSGNWTVETWEYYLLTIEKPLKERLLEPRLYDELAARQDETVFQKFCISANPNTQKLIKLLLEGLSPMQRTVIEKIFFDGRTEREAAELLNISRSSVCVYKKRALDRIKMHASEVSATTSYIGKLDINTKDFFQKVDEHYHEGSLTKDERFQLWALAEVGGLKEGDRS